MRCSVAEATLAAPGTNAVRGKEGDPISYRIPQQAPGMGDVVYVVSVLTVVVLLLQVIDVARMVVLVVVIVVLQVSVGVVAVVLLVVVTANARRRADVNRKAGTSRR